MTVTLPVGLPRGPSVPVSGQGRPLLRSSRGIRPRPRAPRLRLDRPRALPRDTPPWWPSWSGAGGATSRRSHANPETHYPGWPQSPDPPSRCTRTSQDTPARCDPCLGNERRPDPGPPATTSRESERPVPDRGPKLRAPGPNVPTPSRTVVSKGPRRDTQRGLRG